MLILTRNVNQILSIGNNIQVEVLGVEYNQVRFGITAPKDISIHRKEVYQQIQEEQREVSQVEVMDKTIETRVTEAASDYKMGCENSGFADAHGGIEALKSELFSLVAEWEGVADDDEI